MVGVLVNALFLAEQVMTWLENGVTNVDWWAIHNSPFAGNNDASLYGSYTFGDYGILSRGLTTDNGATEPPAQTPFPAYYGLQMLSHLGHDAGSELVSAARSLLSTLSSKRAGRPTSYSSTRIPYHARGVGFDERRLLARRGRGLRLRHGRLRDSHEPCAGAGLGTLLPISANA